MDTLNSRIRQAINLIGPDRPKDYVIAASEHARQYAESAPELAEVLQSGEVQVAAERYEELDQKALEAQRRFTTASNRARSAVFWAGVAGALLLAAASLSTVLGDALSRILVVLFSVAGVVAGGLAAGWIHSIRSGALLEQWMTRRAEAEAERLRYFNLISREREIPEPLLQLEYFRRYQLDVQRIYYRDRGQQHDTDAGRMLRIGSAAMAAGGITSGLAGVLGASIAPHWASIAGLAVVAQAVAARAENQEATAQHRRNAERYERTRNVLDQLYGMLDSVRSATAAGDLAVMREFVASVHEQLSLEHRQWLEEIGAASEAVNRLEQLLEKYREKSDVRDDG